MRIHSIILLALASLANCREAPNYVKDQLILKDKTFVVDKIKTEDVHKIPDITDDLGRRVDDGINEPLRVAFWNVQRFGQAKATNEEVLTILIEVMKRYEIIVIMEVVDSKLLAPTLLLNALNANVTEKEDTFNLTISDRLGRTSYKEQYAYYYKTSRVQLVSTYQYNDTANDIFQFEPFICVFKAGIDGVEEFAIIPIHTKPDFAVEEINGLAEVYDKFKADTEKENAIIAGDFNGGCSYVTGNDWPNIRLAYEKKFKWMISDHADTTTKGTSCPYDRIVVAGKDLVKAVYEESALPFYFDEVYGINNSDLVEDVSDHYPVEIKFRGSVSSKLKANIGTLVQTGLSVGCSVTSAAMSTMVETELNSKCENTSTTMTTPADFINGQDILMLEWSADNIDGVQDSLTRFAGKHPDVLNTDVLKVLQYKIAEHALTDSSLYGEENVPSKIHVGLLCRTSQELCNFSVMANTKIN